MELTDWDRAVHSGAGSGCTVSLSGGMRRESGGYHRQASAVLWSQICGDGGLSGALSTPSRAPDMVAHMLQNVVRQPAVGLFSLDL